MLEAGVIKHGDEPMCISKTRNVMRRAWPLNFCP
jgi:hypothetical protein